MGWGGQSAGGRGFTTCRLDSDHVRNAEVHVGQYYMGKEGFCFDCSEQIISCAGQYILRMYII